MYKIKSINLHACGILLSLSSSGFGMLRDFLIVYLLGFSKLNDILQIYLSLYFVIGLFADPLRLTYLNLIKLRIFKQLLLFFLSVVSVFIILFITLLFIINPDLNIKYLFLAGFDGFLGIFATLLVFHKQRFGAYLFSQLVSTLPSFIMIPAVIALIFLPQDFYVLSCLLAFMLVHILQLFLLRFIHISDNGMEKSQLRFVDLWFLLRHCISVLGDQLFQIVGRLIFLQLGHGFVTLASLFMKCLNALRVIFVDTYIGIKISSWNASDSSNRFFELIDNKLINLLMVLCAFFICYFNTLNFYLIGLQFFAIGVISFYFTALHRIVYFQFNRHFHYSNLVTFTGILDLFSAICVFVCLKMHIKTHIMLIVCFWYILRLFMQITVLRLYAHKFKVTTSSLGHSV